MGKAYVLTAIALALSSFALGLAVSSAAYGGQFERSAFRNVSDRPMPAVVEQRPEAGEQAAAPDSEPISDAVYEEPEPDYVWEPEWAAGPAWTSPDAISEPVGETDFKTRGVVYEDGTRFTWYSEAVLPGGGLDELNGNGRHTDGEGYVRDADGYIAVASSDHEVGTVLDTPFGDAKVYDTGCPSGTVDVYVNWR